MKATPVSNENDSTELGLSQEPESRMHSDPDVALMLRVKEDDAVAFEYLIDRL